MSKRRPIDLTLADKGGRKTQIDLTGDDPEKQIDLTGDDEVEVLEKRSRQSPDRELSRCVEAVVQADIAGGLSGTRWSLEAVEEAQERRAGMRGLRPPHASVEALLKWCGWTKMGDDLVASMFDDPKNFERALGKLGEAKAKLAYQVARVDYEAARVADDKKRSKAVAALENKQIQLKIILIDGGGASQWCHALSAYASQTLGAIFEIYELRKADRLNLKSGDDFYKKYRLFKARDCTPSDAVSRSEYSAPNLATLVYYLQKNDSLVVKLFVKRRKKDVVDGGFRALTRTGLPSVEILRLSIEGVASPVVLLRDVFGDGGTCIMNCLVKNNRESPPGTPASRHNFFGRPANFTDTIRAQAMIQARPTKTSQFIGFANAALDMAEQAVRWDKVKLRPHVRATQHEREAAARALQDRNPAMFIHAIVYGKGQNLHYHVDNTGHWVVLFSVGASCDFHASTATTQSPNAYYDPLFGGHQPTPNCNFTFRSGDAIIFNGAPRHKVLHGINNVHDPTTAPDHLPDWLQKTRISVQVRQYDHKILHHHHHPFHHTTRSLSVGLAP